MDTTSRNRAGLGPGMTEPLERAITASMSAHLGIGVSPAGQGPGLLVRSEGLTLGLRIRP